MVVGEYGDVARVSIRNRKTGALEVLTGATSPVLRFQKPDGSRVDKVATVASDGTALLYTFEINFVDQAGEWRVSPRALVSGVFLIGEPITFRVEQGLLAP